MVNMIDTDQVAEHLQASGRRIDKTSVAKTLKREGIDPLFRKPGVGGQNVFDADAVFAVWPKIDETVVPVFTVKGRSRKTEVDLVAEVTGVPILEMSGTGTRRQQPERLHGQWTNHHDGQGWAALITVSGRYARKDGTVLSSSVEDHVWFNAGMQPDFDESRVPAWVVKWARDNTPPSVTK